ncbi:class I SAM-dependent methyltransferase [Geobacter sp.]|uniref:class I SAM-dependent methyltransferase n=1 Tax=Geobacter sp. TaxID=46610 RepID=UPI0026166630|nr:class I SAM-dependent methyltransferase [Geobacter sp.]
MRSRSLSGAVPLAHYFLRERVRPGDRVVDATCGNGHDTAFLAELVGAAGTIWAFDIQESALAATRARLEAFGYPGRTELVLAGHERLAEIVTEPVRGVVFNLGFLPGAGRETVTSSATTSAALEQAAGLLLPGGVVTVAVYTGHAGGAEEGRGVEEWAAALSPRTFNVWRCRQMNRSDTAPYLVVVERIPA